MNKSSKSRKSAGRGKLSKFQGGRRGSQKLVKDRYKGRRNVATRRAPKLEEGRANSTKTDERKLEEASGRSREASGTLEKQMSRASKREDRGRSNKLQEGRAEEE
jgi:hypothetical protein